MGDGLKMTGDGWRIVDWTPVTASNSRLALLDGLYLGTSRLLELRAALSRGM